jgi:hypothetical protein
MSALTEALVYPNNGDGTFDDPLTFPFGATLFRAADMNGDGKPDLIGLGGGAPVHPVVLLNTTQPPVSPPPVSPPPVSPPPVSPAPSLVSYPNPFNTPGSDTIRALTAGPGGDMWFVTSQQVASQGTAHVGKISPSGVVTVVAPTGDPIVNSLAAGSDGNLWAISSTDTVQGSQYHLLEITPGGAVTSTDLPDSDYGLIAGPDGNLWFIRRIDSGVGGTTSEIATVAPGGSPTYFSVGADEVENLAPGPDGNVWFLALHQPDNFVGKITPAGAITTYPLGPNRQFPGNTFTPYILPGPDSSMWVVDANSPSGVTRITPDGTQSDVATIPNEVSIPDLATGPDGNVYFIGTSGSGQVTPGGTVTALPFPAGAGLARGLDGDLWYVQSPGSQGPISRITFSPIVTVNPAALPGGTVGDDYAQALTATGPDRPAPVFTVSSGALPPGLTLDGTTGTLSGTPTASGAYTFTITAAVGTDSGSRDYTLTVDPAPTSPPPPVSPPPVSPPPPASPPPAVVHLTAPPVPAGGAPDITVRNPDGSVRFTLTAFGGTFTGGAAVAVGDVNGDGVDDVIVGAGDGGGPRVQVFDGVTGQVVADFFAFDPDFRGGVSVAAGPGGEVVTGAGAGGGPRVRVFRDGTAVADFFAFDPDSRGGVSVATGDANGDGVADVVVGAGPGGGPHVRVFDGATGAGLASFFVGPVDDRGGARVVVRDLGGTGANEVVTHAAGRTGAFDPLTGADRTSEFDPSVLTGVFVE